MSELHHECGIAAVYHLPGEASPLCPDAGPDEVSRLIPRMLLDIQNRGQLSAGMTGYNPDRRWILTTHRDVGMVSEVFRLNHKGKAESVMKKTIGRAAIGHVRYATCGAEDRSYAQPFERKHIQKGKWFSFGFNGQLANYTQLRDQLLATSDNHLTCDNDTEIIMHELGRVMSLETPERQVPLPEVWRRVAPKLDGAYSLVMLNAIGEMLVVRDPLGIKPLCWAKEGNLFATASESVALLNLGFRAESVKSLGPGEFISITADGTFVIDRFAPARSPAHCFFEWIYFANVASTMDERGVYISRSRLGEELARLETVPIDEDTIVVPVPDTSKAAADAMAFKLRVPSREGLIRNRYSGRTFIEGKASRRQKAEAKYTPLREVLEGKRVLLVEDSIVRSTTMQVLLNRIRELGGAKEIHVRVASPPIIAPCFYGIDMSTVGELFAPKFLDQGLLTEEAQAKMAKQLGADSLRYLPVDAISRAIGLKPTELCQACITGQYPTPCGQQLYQVAIDHTGRSGRTYEKASV
jgi:amidophosphoribosyltransferase